MMRKIKCAEGKAAHRAYEGAEDPGKENIFTKSSQKNKLRWTAPQRVI
jgi:hypothetical protein